MTPAGRPRGRVGDHAQGFESLDGDGDGDGDRVAGARAELDEVPERLSADVAAKPGLRVIAASGSLGEPRPALRPVAGHGPGRAGGAPRRRGLLGGPQLGGGRQVPGRPRAGRRAERHPRRAVEQTPPTTAALPTVEADQTIAWPASLALGYGNVTAVIDDITTAVDSAPPTSPAPPDIT